MFDESYYWYEDLMETDDDEEDDADDSWFYDPEYDLEKDLELCFG